MSMTMRMDRGMRNASSSALNASTTSTASLASASSPSRRSKSVSHVPAASSPSTTSSSSNGRRSVASVNAKDSSGSGRVRVTARLRPRNAEEIIADADFPDCVELQPELKRLRLRKNNWESETFQFDEVFTEAASQKRVYEVVAKPVVESVLNGYNGTVMAYGQTGTGKTFTLGKLGEKDSAERGIMVRALEDILADINPDYDSVTVSYLQLYLESVQDLLAPGKDNIPIVEDPKSGDVSLPGATMVQVHAHKSFVQLLKTGEVNRYATNTKMNTESSRSHAILLVYVKRSVTEKKENERPGHHENGSQSSKANRLPMVRKSKLLLVDLAGSERVNKAGSEGHTLDEAKAINLSLTALGKCINALAENSPHIPIRDSKLTRLLRDSFGGSARTSLVITIGPSPRHRGETASTIMFGQRAMKVENMVKLKEEFDYKSLCRKLENQLDTLTIENERQSKFANDAKQEMERQLKETQLNLIDAEKKLALGSEALIKEKSKMQDEIGNLERKLEQGHAHHEMMTKMIDNLKTISEEKEKEFLLEHQKDQDELYSLSLSYQSDLEDLNKQLEAESIRKERLEKELHLIKQELKKKSEKVSEMEVEKMQQQEQIIDLRQRCQQEICEITQKLNAEHAQSQHVQEQMRVLEQNISASHKRNETRDQSEILELRKKLDDQTRYQESLEKELHGLQVEREENTVLKEKLHEELQNTIHKLKEEQRQRSLLEEELITLKQQISQLTSEVNENKKILEKENSGKFSVGSECYTNIMRSTHVRDTINGQRATIAKLFEEVGLPKILSLLESEDVDVRIHAVKVLANLAAEEVNQEKIVEAGGLTSLLMLLETSEDETIQRVAAGAIANLAMNEKNQELIMKQGGIKLLAKIANKAEDPQTLRMVAGAIANLCGNDKLQLKLRDEGGIKALLGMVRSRYQDVLAQVARGVANFAKCESRGAIQGHRKGRSLLIDDGALPWIVTNSNSEATPIRRHIELALCHLAQHEANARDLVACGALWELFRISRECSREDIRNLARRTLNTSATFQNELKRMHSPYD